MECQPCREQGQHASAEFWCTECEEVLCENCKSLHRSFKLSRNHNVSVLAPLSGNKLSDKQQELADDGKDKWVMCDEHHDKYLEYFCIKHDKPCCILCKRQYHKNCCEVEKVDDVANESKLATSTADLLSVIEERKSHLTKAANNEMSNLRDLELNKDNCIEELKNTRIAIDEHLDLLQNEVEKEIYGNYENYREDLNNKVADLTTKQRYLSDKKKIIEETLEHVELPVGQKYLKIMRLKLMEDECYESSETLPESSLQCVANYKLSYAKNDNNIIIKIHRNLKGKNNEIDKTQENEDGIETCSSVVEFEPNESETVSLVFSEPSFAIPVTNAHTFICPKTFPVDLPHTLPVTSLSSFSVTQAIQVPGASLSSSFDFYLKSSFFVEKRNKNIAIHDFKLMPNKYDIAIAENSTPRCMVYNKDGQKKGQIKLIGEPECIAIIDTNCIGVTLRHQGNFKVCVLDVHKWQLVNTVDIHDDCQGLVYFNNNLIATCANEGLLYIDDSGKIVEQDINMKGILYLHLDNHGNIYSAKRGTKIIHVYNLTANKRSWYHLKGLRDPTGLTTDRDNNLFVACNENDTILVKQSLHSAAKIVLDSSNGIERPMSIDYDLHNDELLVANNFSHSIFIFKKK
ncbi:PML [Mytilus coruscus]|uniref:PML n=1 Tax=Mytilus coruscus TaxID=42192 RepID=A0A6J8CU11_MYTCO|nr:PML [Mytilus coruscus]